LLLKNEFKHLKVVVAPRGMFGKGALAIKRTKKAAFLLYCKISRLHKNVIWHATSSTEFREIEKALGDVAIKIISNFPKKVGYKKGIGKEKGSICIYFSGRISEKKNLYFALEILSIIKGPNIKFNIYGLIEDKNYWERCLRRINHLPPNILVEYRGTYKPNEVELIINEHHLLLFPTLNENYGHSIVESLLCGCPVIISDQTPWKDLQKHGAGFALPLTDKKAFAKAIEGYAAMSEIEFDKARKQAIYYIEQKTEVETTRQLYKELFNV
jgi:glycosyltransferase involved in cell wall biosynthesis